MTEHLLAGGLYWTELRIILQVARSRSFNKAADEVGVSHPTVARAVRRLEIETGTAVSDFGTCTRGRARHGLLGKRRNDKF
jgi:Bacterial regulatory helix-turn-helix protein, lysR family